jgi:phage terminase small subunit
MTNPTNDNPVSDDASPPLVSPGRTRLTAKQDAFVELRASTTLSGAECYRRAGYTCKTDKVAADGASKLLTSPGILSAITHRKGQVQARRDTSADSLIESAWTVYLGAIEDKQWSAANAALTTIGRLTGHITDGRKAKARDAPAGAKADGLADWSDAELASLRGRLENGAGVGE